MNNTYIQQKAHYQSPIGPLTMASDGNALVGLWFDGQLHFPITQLENCKENHNLHIFQETRRWLDMYFSGKTPDFTPEINIYATEFRKRVWEILLTIPYAQTTTYGNIADIIAKERGITSMSAQAVGNAVGHNPISIIIPCHRVLGSNKSLTGYAAGIDKKIFLLHLENFRTIV